MWHGTQIHDITSGNVLGIYILCEQKGWGWVHSKGNSVAVSGHGYEALGQSQVSHFSCFKHKTR